MAARHATRARLAPRGAWAIELAVLLALPLAIVAGLGLHATAPPPSAALACPFLARGWPESGFPPPGEPHPYPRGREAARLP